jgi:hypothetical protein
MYVQIGGNLGLFLGLSLISMVDVFNFSRLKMGKYCKCPRSNLKHRRKASANSLEKCEE